MDIQDGDDNDDVTDTDGSSWSGDDPELGDIAAEMGGGGASLCDLGSCSEGLMRAAAHGDVDLVWRYMRELNLLGKAVGGHDIKGGAVNEGIVNRVRTRSRGETALTLAVRFGRPNVGKP
jgi:hypothetical protein